MRDDDRGRAVLGVCRACLIQRRLGGSEPILKPPHVRSAWARIARVANEFNYSPDLPAEVMIESHGARDGQRGGTALTPLTCVPRRRALFLCWARRMHQLRAVTDAQHEVKKEDRAG